MKSLPALFFTALLHFPAARAGTADSIDQVPAAQRPAWTNYLEISRAKAAADHAALQAELDAHGMKSAQRASSGGDFKLSAKPGDTWFGGPEAKALADVVISYQTPAGGWSKHTGYAKGPRQPGMQWSSQSDPGKSPHYLGTFDNRSTTEQMTFLSQVWLATKRDDCAAAYTRGLNYIFAAQYPNGGWPQVYPLEGGYHDCITLNDDALTHILEVLFAIIQNDPATAFLDAEIRGKARAAFDRGIDCVLALQVVQDGDKTAWCAQHDAVTLAPAGARKMEPATLSGVESANLLRFLMTLPDPSPEVIASIESGLAWLERVKITGLRRTTRDGKTVFEPDASSTEPYWARFYNLADSTPVFPGRDGIVYRTFNEMAANNPSGYDFLGTRPGSVLYNGQKKWREKLAASN